MIPLFVNHWTFIASYWNFKVWGKVKGDAHDIPAWTGFFNGNTQLPLALSKLVFTGSVGVALRDTRVLSLRTTG